MMGKPLRVLIVEDSADDTELLLRRLRRGGYEPESMRVETPEALSEALDRQAWDLVIADYSLPRFSGPAALELLRARSSSLPLIMISGGMTDQNGVIAMQCGANDYVMKGNLDRLIPAIERELRDATTRSERQHLQKDVARKRHELEIARSIQQRLFPSVAPRIAGFDITGACFPAEETSGDYFDFIPMLDGGLAIAIGDVSGHGLGPALVMAQMHTCLRTLAVFKTRLDEIVCAANLVLSDFLLQGSFLTLFLARLDKASRHLIYTGAGHQGYILDRSGALKMVLESTDVPIGVLSDVKFPIAAPVQLEADDLVLLMTDGVWEATSPDNSIFDTERAIDVVRASRRMSAMRIVNNLYEAVRDFMQNRSQEDDVTIVVIKSTM